MNMSLWISFVGTVLIIGVTPGPSVLLASANSMSHGTKKTIGTTATARAPPGSERGYKHKQSNVPCRPERAAPRKTSAHPPAFPHPRPCFAIASDRNSVVPIIGQARYARLHKRQMTDVSQ